MPWPIRPGVPDDEGVAVTLHGTDVQPLSVLIVGGGMYVAGRGVPGSRGTIAPALLEAARAARAGKIGRLGVATTRLQTALDAREAILALAAEMGVTVPVEALADLVEAVAAFHPDAAVVAVPDHRHAAVTVPLAQAGIHCLVVKPMADTLDSARAMADAARASGIVAQVEFHKRLDESNLVLRDAVRSGHLGQPLYAVIEYSQKKMIPRDVFRDWAATSNVFRYLGVHYVDLLHWATGFVPVRVTAWGQKAYLAALGVDTWDANAGGGGMAHSPGRNLRLDPYHQLDRSRRNLGHVGPGHQSGRHEGPISGRSEAPGDRGGG
jgi:predicted dehydrogenase